MCDGAAWNESGCATAEALRARFRSGEQSGCLRVRRPASFEPLQKHLLLATVGAAQHMAEAVAAHKMANFLGYVLHVVAGPLQRLRHKQHLNTLPARLEIGRASCRERV